MSLTTALAPPPSGMPTGPGPFAAVAAVLREPTATPEDLEILLIRRAERPGDLWSGHVALPGGRHETSDATLVETASRETAEEVAIDLAASGELLGALPPVAPRLRPQPLLAIHPFVWLVDPLTSPSISEEVSRTIWTPLASLLDPAAHVEHRVHDPAPGGITYRFPGITIASGEELLWGITRAIVLDLLERAGMRGITND